MADRGSMQRSEELAILQEQRQFVVAQAAAAAAISIINTIDIVVKGVTYRSNLAAIVKSLQTDHVMRHDDVDKLIEILDLFGFDMSQTVKDEYYLTILDLLRASGRPGKYALPPPP
jgi:hypothetical protein